MKFGNRCWDSPKYEINPKGIRHAITHNILKPYLSSTGYLSVKLYINTKNSLDVSLHIAMATQYIHNPDPNILIKVNHKNGVKIDYSIENLEWTTQSQNMQHAVDTGLLKNRKGGHKNIDLLDEDHNLILTFDTYQQAAKHVGFDYRLIGNYLRSNMSEDNITIINGFVLRYRICIDLEGEIWKNVNTDYPNINNRYKVSNYGRFKNEKNKLLSTGVDLKGYGQIDISNYIKGKKLDDNRDDHRKTFSVHRLIAFTFLEFEGNKDDYQVDHKDKNPHNNHVDNLEILTTKEHMIKDKGKQVLCVTKNNEYYIFRSQGEAAEFFEVKTGTINATISKKPDYKNHLLYDLDSKEAQYIILKLKSEGITQSIPPKSYQITQTQPQRKLKLIIVS